MFLASPNRDESHGIPLSFARRLSGEINGTATIPESDCPTTGWRGVLHSADREITLDARLKEATEVAQACINAPPVLVIGSGLSMGSGIRGMGKLAEYLIENVKVSEADQQTWRALSEAIKAQGLEQALQASSVSPALLAEIIRHTRAMVCHDDVAVLHTLLDEKATLPLSQLFTHLFQSTHRTLHVVTTNYDRLVEYAADYAGFQHDAGFTQGYLRTRKSRPRSGAAVPETAIRTVAVAKVHGSLDWFRRPNNTVMGAPLGVEYPSSLSPAIVTPGATKYEQAYDEPFRTAITSADNYLSGGKAYLCLGYGFNDKHIQPKLVERVRQHKVPVVILAKSLTDATKQFLKTCCQSQFLAVEESGTGSRIYDSANRDGCDVAVSGLWQLERFLETLTL